MLLGGSYGQMPAIEEAKRRGYYTILCDYLPDNPGQYLVDQYIPASTTDVAAILDIAREHDIDAILGYASDPATYTCAVVSEALDLPGNPPSSIAQLTDKGLFRAAQQQAGLPTPEFRILTGNDVATGQIPDLAFPYIIKPVDSSDTKGVYNVSNEKEFTDLAQEALQFSRSNTLIAETMIDANTVNLHGDGFVIDGQIAFMALGKVMFYAGSTKLKPSATWYPGDIEKNWLPEAERQINKLLQETGFHEGPINIEARADASGTLYLMEIGPRSGGGMTPQTIAHAYGFDMLAATFDLLERKRVVIQTHPAIHTMLMTMHVNDSGTISSIVRDQDLEPFLVEAHLSVKEGDSVKSYDQPASSLGAYIYQFPDDTLLTKNRDDLYHRIIDQIQIAQ